MKQTAIIGELETRHLIFKERSVYMEPFCFDFSNEEISTILFCMEYFKNCHIKADTSEVIHPELDGE